MKTKQKMWLGVCAGLLVGAATLTTASTLTSDAPQDALLLANIEALSQNEGGQNSYGEVVVQIVQTSQRLHINNAYDKIARNSGCIISGCYAEGDLACRCPDGTNTVEFEITTCTHNY